MEIIAFTTELQPIRKKKQKELSLCSQNIHIITKELASFHSLTSLYLCCNEINEFPKSILQLKNIVFVSLKVNNLSILPNLSTLGKLKELDVSHNRLHSISHLPLLLKKIDLSNNSIAKLPPSIGQLKKLQSLNISNNPLINLPSTIHNCRYLAKLGIANCAFVEKPATNHFMSLKEIAAKQMIENHQKPQQVERFPSHEDKLQRKSSIRNFSLSRKPLKIMNNDRTKDSLISLSSLNINKKDIPDHLMVYFKDYNTCSSCSAPIWNSFQRFSTLRRDTDIPLEHLLCSNHWTSDEERIESFFEAQ